MDLTLQEYTARIYIMITIIIIIIIIIIIVIVIIIVVINTMIVMTMIITIIINYKIGEYGNFCFTETGKNKNKFKNVTYSQQYYKVRDWRTVENSNYCYLCYVSQQLITLTSSPNHC